MGAATQLLSAAKKLSSDLKAIDFSSVARCVYDPFDYAYQAYAEYVKRYLSENLRTVYFGMNPGPWGMVQTGVPFGEVAIVKEWLKITSQPTQPAIVHPKRPILGHNCHRSEVSGRRLWTLFRNRFATPERFFADQFVANYCPLAFMEESGKNLTPDKFPIAIRTAVQSACDRHMSTTIRLLKPEFLVAIGGFAEQCGQRACVALPSEISSPKIVRILHPSPASPAANRQWDLTVTKSLTDAGVWS